MGCSRVLTERNTRRCKTISRVPPGRPSPRPLWRQRHVAVALVARPEAWLPSSDQNSQAPLLEAHRARGLGSLSANCWDGACSQDGGRCLRWTFQNAEKPATDASVSGLQGTDHAGAVISSPIAEQSPKTQDGKRVRPRGLSPVRSDTSSPESGRKDWLRASARTGTGAASMLRSGSSRSTPRSGRSGRRCASPRGHGHDEAPRHRRAGRRRRHRPRCPARRLRVTSLTAPPTPSR